MYNYIRIQSYTCIYIYHHISWKIIEYQISLKIAMQLYASMQFDRMTCILWVKNGQDLKDHL